MPHHLPAAAIGGKSDRNVKLSRSSRIDGVFDFVRGSIEHRLQFPLPAACEIAQPATATWRLNSNRYSD